jgi:hypothetical protein
MKGDIESRDSASRGYLSQQPGLTFLKIREQRRQPRAAVS